MKINNMKEVLQSLFENGVIINEHDCPVKIWDQFTFEGKQIYNGFMKQAMPSQMCTVPYYEDGAGFSDDAWKILCHNMACYAAWAKNPKEIVCD